MRTLIIFITILIGVTSCSPVLKLGRLPAAVPPYVQLKDGTVIQAKEVGQAMEFMNGSILADDQKFPSKNVVKYSNGEQTFVKLPEGKFGPKTAEGKINVYSITNATHYGYAAHDYMRLYIQDSGSSNLSFLSYKALKRIIPNNTAAAKELANYKKGRRVIHLSMLGGFACFIGGAILTGNSVMKDKSNTTIKGNSNLMFAGMGIMACVSIPIFTEKMKLRRTIAIYNEVYSNNH